jgi:hypothetical protein
MPVKFPRSLHARCRTIGQDYGLAVGEMIAIKGARTTRTIVDIDVQGATPPLHPFYQNFLKGYRIAKFCKYFRLRSYDPGNTQPRPILEVKQGSALISSMVGDHIRTERDVAHAFAIFFPGFHFYFTSLLYFKTSLAAAYKHEPNGLLPSTSYWDRFC